jgi:hypothetical protein
MGWGLAAPCSGHTLDITGRIGKLEKPFEVLNLEILYKT